MSVAQRLKETRLGRKIFPSDDDVPRGKEKETFNDHAFLHGMKAREKYVFHSDYFQIDDRYFGCVMSFFHKEGADDKLYPFWGISRIPNGIDNDDNVTVMVTDQISVESQDWVESKLKTSDRLEKLDASEQQTSGTRSTKMKHDRVSDDMVTTIAELQDGATYVHVHNRLFLKSSSLKALDEAVENIRSQYLDTMSTMSISAYPGEQRHELSTLWDANDKKRGKGFYYTSTEFAGSYSLVTNGLNDPGGEYVGELFNEVNSSAVLFDINDFASRAVVAMNQRDPAFRRARRSAMWGSAMGQAALLDGNRVVHLVLDDTKFDLISPALPSVTYHINLNSGDVNPFEMFGQTKDELSIFPRHVNKLVLMAKQMRTTGGDTAAVIDGQLRQVINDFYVTEKMWSRNAKAERNRLRLVGLDHDQYPTLSDFLLHTEELYTSERTDEHIDQVAMSSAKIINQLFTDMQESNGDLFDVKTKSSIDGAATGQRVVYNFSELRERGRNVAMAQLVNVIGFATSTMGEGDLVVLHGAEEITKEVEDFIAEEFESLSRRGARVAYLYNSVEAMIERQSFNKFDAADYTILGKMRETTLNQYVDALAQQIPNPLKSSVTSTAPDDVVYLRRGPVNVVFRSELDVGIDPPKPGAVVDSLASSSDTDREAVKAMAVAGGVQQPVISSSGGSTSVTSPRAILSKKRTATAV